MTSASAKRESGEAARTRMTSASAKRSSGEAARTRMTSASAKRERSTAPSAASPPAPTAASRSRRWRWASGPPRSPRAAMSPKPLSSRSRTAASFAGVRVDLVPVRERVFQLYRRAAEPILPEARLWGVWSPRQIVDHVRSKRPSPALNDLTDFVEEIYFSPRISEETVLPIASERVDRAIHERTSAAS